MEVILLKDVAHVGSMSEVVTVKNGYGRNYLIPQGMAIIANATNRRQLADKLRQQEAMAAKLLEEFRAVAAQVEGKTLTIGAKSGTSGKIFGSVTNVQIAAALQSQLGVKVERKRVHLTEEVKMIGQLYSDYCASPRSATNRKFCGCS
jgi:large subunit ribosomal protein L9